MHEMACLKSWKWLFLLPGLPIIPLGIAAYFVLGNMPETIQCKSN